MMFVIIQNNYACVIVCILFLIFICSDRSFPTKTEHLFLLAVCLLLALTAVDALELYEARLSSPTLTRLICSAVGYALRPITAVLIIRILYRWMSRRPGTAVQLLPLPFVINAVACITSIWSGWVFSYSPENEFVRGPVWWLPFATGAFYVLAMVVVTLLQVHIHRLSETLIVLAVAVLSVGGTLMETLFGFDGTLNTSCAIGLVFYYLYLHVSLYTIDQLTGAYSRRIFYLDIRNLHRSSAVLVGIDLNDLKHINDTGGHAAGDAALLSLTQAIRRQLPSGCTLYRVGGDEFMLLCRFLSPEEAQALMNDVEKELRPQSCSFAFGVSLYRQGEDIDRAIEDADMRMYQMKAEMKPSSAED